MSQVEKVRVDISGGMGKQIAATAYLQAVRDQLGPEAHIHVVTSYPDVFKRLPCLTPGRIYQMGQPVPYLREVHKEFQILNGEPYLRLAFRRGEEHLVDAFCRANGITPPQKLTGTLKLTDKEHATAEQLLSRVDRSKKWVAFQPFGGTSFHNPADAADHLRPKQCRDLPRDIAQTVVDRLHQAGHVVIQISLPTEPRLEKTVCFDLGVDEKQQPKVLHPRALFAILNMCQYFIGIDSFAQHAWAALGKKAGDSVVLWGATKPKNFSYACHKDLVVDNPCDDPHCSRPDMALGDICDGNNIWQCPDDGPCMRFNPETIIRELGIKAPPPPAVTTPPETKETKE